MFLLSQKNTATSKICYDNKIFCLCILRLFTQSKNFIVVKNKPFINNSVGIHFFWQI